jgi:hypothetical protein
MASLMESKGRGDKGVHDSLFFSGLLFNQIERINELSSIKHKAAQEYHNSVLALYNTWNYYIFGGGDQEPDMLFVEEVKAYEQNISENAPTNPQAKQTWYEEQYPILVADVYYKAVMKSIGRQGLLPGRKRVIVI